MDSSKVSSLASRLLLFSFRKKLRDTLSIKTILRKPNTPPRIRLSSPRLAKSASLVKNLARSIIPTTTPIKVIKNAVMDI